MLHRNIGNSLSRGHVQKGASTNRRVHCVTCSVTPFTPTTSRRSSSSRFGSSFSKTLLQTGPSPQQNQPATTSGQGRQRMSVVCMVGVSYTSLFALLLFNSTAKSRHLKGWPTSARLQADVHPLTHIYTRAHAHSQRTCARTHTYNTHIHTRAHTLTHTHPHTHTNTHTPPLRHTHTHTHTRAHTHTQHTHAHMNSKAHTRMHAHTRS